MRNPTPEFPEFLKSFSEEELNNSQFTAIHRNSPQVFRQIQ